MINLKIWVFHPRRKRYSAGDRRDWEKKLKRFFVACDLGTTVIKAGVVDYDRGLIGVAAKAAPAYEMPMGAFDAREYLGTLCKLIRELRAKGGVRGEELAGIVLSSQRSTTVLLDEHNNPLGPALSWQSAVCERLSSEFYDRFGRKRYLQVSGLPPSAIYTAAKLAHSAQSEPHLLRRTRKVALLPAYVYTALGAEDVVSDVSGASASGLFDLEKGTWSREITDAIGIQTEQLPALAPAGARVGELSDRGAELTGLPRGLPLLLGGADQQCAALGAGLLESRQGLISLGTAGVIQIALEQLPLQRAQGLLHMCHAAPNRWVLEGFTGTLGGAFEWAARLLGLNGVPALESLARSSPDCPGSTLFLPFLAGIGTPDYSAETRGAFFGLGLESAPRTLASAVLRGGAYELRRILEEMQKNQGVARLAAVGGGATPYFLQLVADVTGFQVDSLEQSEAALLGAAALGFSSLEEAPSLAEMVVRFAPPVVQGFRPRASSSREEEQYRRYCHAVASVKSLHEGNAS